MRFIVGFIIGIAIGYAVATALGRKAGSQGVRWQHPHFDHAAV